MIQKVILVATAGFLAVIAGCSSESSTKAPSGASSKVGPPSVDLGEESGSAASGTKSSAASSGAAGASGEGWGTLSGRFVYDGTAPERPALQITKDQEFCTMRTPLAEDLVVNPDDGGIQNVVVMLYLKRGDKAPESHSSYAESINEPVTFDNEWCRFEPHVCTVRVGQKLVIGNKDEVGHNTKADLSSEPFNELIAVGGTIEKTLSAPERLPAPVSCNIHPWMNAYLIVTDHPYVAVSDENGNFKLENLPAGEWTFQVWHEKSSFIQDVEIDGKAAEWSKGRPTFTVNVGENNLGEIKLKPAIFEK